MPDPIPDPIVISEDPVKTWIANKLIVLERKIDGIVERTITVEQGKAIIDKLHEMGERIKTVGQ